MSAREDYAALLEALNLIAIEGSTTARHAAIILQAEAVITALIERLIEAEAERNDWRSKANDIDHDGTEILWSERYSAVLRDYKGENADLRQDADAYKASLKANFERSIRAEAQATTLQKALREIIAADDEFRASMADGVEKDPVTLACDRARSHLDKR